MSTQFDRFRPLEAPEIELFDPDAGISPADAGREDARAAMIPAREILRQLAKELKLTRVLD